MIWESITIGDLGKVITGNTPPKKNPEFYGDAYKFIKPTDMTVGNRYTPITDECYSYEAFKKYKKSLIPPLSTCVVTIGSIGQKMTMTKEESFVNQAVNAIIPNDNFDPFFVFYAVKNILSKVKNADTGASSGRENVSKSNFMSLNLKVPKSKDTQKKIADILSAYDDSIENNLKRIKLLEEAAQNIYKEWFVNFRFPNHENTPINEETGLPEGWSYQELGSNISKLESGKRPKGGIDKSLKEGVPSIGAESIRGLGYFDFSKTKYITEEYFLAMNKGIIQDKDILIYKDGAYIGRSTLFQDNFPYEKCTINEHVFLIQSKNKELQYYLYFLLHSSEYFNKMQSLNSNAAQPGINQAKLKQMKILLPVNLDLLKEFNSAVCPMVTQIYSLAKSNKKLKEARDILLPRLMNQTIEV